MPISIPALIAPPAVLASPVRLRGGTTSSTRTWVVVKSYLRQCAPPAFPATLPPMVHTDCEDGSGGIEVSPRCSPLGHMRVNHSELYHNLPIGKIDLENAVHARQTD